MSYNNRLEATDGSTGRQHASDAHAHFMREVLQSGMPTGSDWQGHQTGASRQSERDLNRQGAEALDKFFQNHIALTGNLYTEVPQRRQMDKPIAGDQKPGKDNDGDKLPSKPPANPTYDQVDQSKHRIDHDQNQIDNSKLRERYWSDEKKRDEAEAQTDKTRDAKDKCDVEDARKLLDKCDDETELKHSFEDQKLRHQSDKNAADQEILSAENRRQSGITQEDIGKSRYQDGEKALKAAEELRKLEGQHRKEAEDALKSGDLDRAQALIKKAKDEHEQADKKEKNGEKWKLEGTSLQKTGQHEQEEAQKLKDDAQKRKERAEKMLELDNKILCPDGVAKNYKDLQKKVVDLEKKDTAQNASEIAQDNSDIKSDGEKFDIWKKAEDLWTNEKADAQKYYDDVLKNYNQHHPQVTGV